MLSHHEEHDNQDGPRSVEEWALLLVYNRFLHNRLEPRWAATLFMLITHNRYSAADGKFMAALTLGVIRETRGQRVFPDTSGKYTTTLPVNQSPLCENDLVVTLEMRSN
jgi:hypothetical protein